jgi:1-aminocyclopropane-1-carboxylate deaminase/D-cysteine desulfhydrase-like pyridoxal-dependent ACC family enzyme
VQYRNWFVAVAGVSLKISRLVLTVHVVGCSILKSQGRTKEKRTMLDSAASVVKPSTGSISTTQRTVSVESSAASAIPSIMFLQQDDQKL